MIKSTLLLTDDVGPHENNISMMIMTADWQRRRGTVFKLDIVAYSFYDASDYDSRLFPAQDGWLMREQVVIQDHSEIRPMTRLRTHGGHFVPFALHWGTIKQTVDASGYPMAPSLFSHGGGDWFPGLDQKLVAGEVRRQPLRFTAANSRAYPTMRKAFKRAFDLAVKCQPYCARCLEQFPAGLPYRAAIRRRYPERHSASSLDAY